jgi:hypothetical protein
MKCLAAHREPPPPAHTTRWGKIRFSPRHTILNEVIAGFLWMDMDLPQDVSRDEIEDLARRLISSIEAKADEHVIEGALVHFQRNQLYKSTKPLNLRKLAQRAVVAVKAA